VEDHHLAAVLSRVPAVPLFLVPSSVTSSYSAFPLLYACSSLGVLFPDLSFPQTASNIPHPPTHPTPLCQHSDYSGRPRFLSIVLHLFRTFLFPRVCFKAFAFLTLRCENTAGASPPLLILLAMGFVWYLVSNIPDTDRNSDNSLEEQGVGGEGLRGVGSCRGRWVSCSYGERTGSCGWC